MLNSRLLQNPLQCLVMLHLLNAVFVTLCALRFAAAASTLNLFFFFKARHGGCQSYSKTQERGCV